MHTLLNVRTGKVDRWTTSETRWPQRAQFRGSAADPLEIIRRKIDRRISLQARRRGRKCRRKASGDHRYSRRPGRPVPPGISGAQQLFHQRTRHRRDLSQRARLHGYGKTFVYARQRISARGFVQGHQLTVRLDRDAAGSRRVAHHGHRRQLRRIHDACRCHQLQRPHSLLAWISSARRTW